MTDRVDANGELPPNPRYAQALADEDYMALVGIALSARAKADEGRYCECDDPYLTGLDLLCGRCLLNSRDQEVRRLLDTFGAHDFEQAEGEAARALGWCRCAWPESSPRHHGEDIRCTTSWGEVLEPPFDALRAHYIGSKGAQS